VLAAHDVPPLLLDATSDPPPRLGWNTWVPGPDGGFIARGDAADAVFEAEVIEAQKVEKAA
jgi:predicted component of type VI protein secretion system